MDDPDKFIEIVNSVCRRPAMYTLTGTFGEVAAYFMGIACGSDSPISDDSNRSFDYFVTARLLVPSKYSWAGAIRLVAADDAEAIDRLRELLVEFANLRKSQSSDEIRADAARIVADYEETEPAKVWRRFLTARHKADQAEIEKLILPHRNASVFWNGDPAPPGVAAQLRSISDCYVVPVVSGSLEAGHVQLVTELGKIDAHLVDGSWRIDATPIVEMDVGNA